jgi:hypothetical protein
MAMSPQRPFSDQYLLEYSAVHVHYEVDHFFWLAGLLSPRVLIGAQSTDDGRRISNILIEGFGLHLRNVIDFLYPRNLRPTDIVAADFLLNGKWDTIRSPITETLMTARTRADKEMAHLTTERIFGAPPEKDWNFQALANEVRPILRLMCDNALSTRLAANVAAAIR